MSARAHRVYFRLQRAAHLARKAADSAILESAGITTAQAAVLNLVAERPGISQRRLAALLAQNESATTSMIGRLVGAGLVTKRRDTEDARAYRIGLTARGRKVRASAGRAFQAINAALDDALGERRIERLAKDLETAIGAFSPQDEGGDGRPGD